MALYDEIGKSYSEHRRPEPRIAAYVERALGDARIVVNVGAGTGSYEPVSRVVVAVEPSITMIRQRRNGPVVQAGAEALPFADGSFDAATAFITIHHWSNWRAGVAEMRRVARRVLILGVDIEVLQSFWITDYFTLWEREVVRDPEVDDVVDVLGGADVITVPTPHDCIDGFLLAYWRRPEAYLDPSVRACISGFARSSDAELAPGLTRLRADLDSGEWGRKYGHLMELDEYDTGLRLVVSR
ncbi:MAG: class I SAM-dependent methyltransferase [Actinobacteria bacterium]|nr:class I SAM-dependent methyltransferase [Actinomycetota bacterium]